MRSKNSGSQVADIKELPQNATKNAPVSQIQFPTIEFGHCPPQRQEINFSHVRENPVSRVTGILLPPQNVTETRVANLVLKHRIGAFPTQTPINIFFACARKIPAFGQPTFWNCPRMWAKTRWCRKYDFQPSNCGIHTIESRDFLHACVKNISWRCGGECFNLMVGTEFATSARFSSRSGTVPKCQVLGVTVMLVQCVLPMAACPWQAQSFMSFHILVFYFCISRKYDVSQISWLGLLDMKCLRMYYRGDTTSRQLLPTQGYILWAVIISLLLAYITSL